ncbi:MAG: purine-binding chemotaxis protein CheW [Methylococcales bacterium]|nr:purine-binding chemotaxis protein CheW [Methylococcales bacterium]
MTNNYSIKDDSSNKEQLIQMVGFKIDNETFGVDILMVQEIIRAASITTVPNSPEFVEGVINLRGSIIPVIDLRKRLNLQPNHYKQETDWILILDISGRITGFIVDWVTDVIKVQEKNIDPPPEILVAGLQSQYIRGVCEVEDALLILLDFTRILLVDEMKKLKNTSFDSDQNASDN